MIHKGLGTLFLFEYWLYNFSFLIKGLVIGAKSKTPLEQRSNESKFVHVLCNSKRKCKLAVNWCYKFTVYTADYNIQKLVIDRITNFIHNFVEKAQFHFINFSCKILKIFCGIYQINQSLIIFQAGFKLTVNYS